MERAAGEISEGDIYSGGYASGLAAFQWQGERDVAATIAHGLVKLDILALKMDNGGGGCTGDALHVFDEAGVNDDG